MREIRVALMDRIRSKVTNFHLKSQFRKILSQQPRFGLLKERAITPSPGSCGRTNIRFLTAPVTVPSHQMMITGFNRLMVSWALCLSVNVALAQAPGVSIENEVLAARFSSGSLSLTAKSGQRTFLKECRLSALGGVPHVSPARHPQFGSGQAIEIVQDDGSLDRLMLFRNLPFALFQCRLHNGSNQPTVTRARQSLSAMVDIGKPAAELKSFGTGGLLPLDQNPGSYVWLAVVEPKTRNGVVFGWLTEDRGSGVLFSAVEREAARVEARIDYGHLRLAPGKTEALETLAVGFFEDARLGLEAWADTVAKVHDIHLPPQPAGYCTWYSQPHGGASDEKHLAEQSAYAAKHLAPFGFSVIQIDDKWQEGISTNGPKRNFTTHRSDGPYPSGMKAAAENIKALGLVPGIWFMPFAGTFYDPFFKDHQDWFVKRADGTPYETSWGGTCLDMTHPGPREHLRSLVRRIGTDWGFEYFKLDGLWTGSGTKQQYVNSGYKEDGIGDAVFHNPDKTNIEAYRDGLRLVREAAGRKVFILGCNGPQNMRSYGGAFGLVDGMRIGPDNKAEWKSLLRGPIFGSRHYFLHGRIWYNDPDPVYVRAAMPLAHAQLICSWVSLSGQLNLSSEWFPDLPAERLDILKRTLPGHGLLPRPVDLFERELPAWWLLTDTCRSPRRDVVGVFNWESKEQRFDMALNRLGLNDATEYVAFDFWENELLPPVKKRLQVVLPGESCRVLAVRPRKGYPQVISTSRHITQGITDLLEEKWDPETRELRGRSKIVGGDPYELRIVTTLAAERIEVSLQDQSSGVRAAMKQSENLLRASLESSVSREVLWSVRFK